MFDVSRIKENDDKIFAFKIVEKKYVDSIAKHGQIYFNLLENYRIMGSNDMTEIGDFTEATLSKNIYQYIEIDGEYEEIHGVNAGYNSRVNANQCAFCFYMIGLKNYVKESDNTYRHIIPAKDLELFCKEKGGVENCAILIFDRNLIPRIYSELRNRNLSYAGNQIAYDDFYYIPKNETNSLAYALEVAFHKSSRLKYQHEFRIVALNTNKAPINDLFIPVYPGDFDVIDLEPNCDFYSVVTVDEREPSEGVHEVCFSALHSLEQSM